MGVYSVMRPDETLIKAADGSKYIIIIGCEGCANESLAYDKNIPQKVRFDESMGHTVLAPDAITEEANRLKSVLQTRVNDIGISSGMGFCSMSSDGKPDELEWIKSCREADTVIVLSCAVGVAGVKTLLGKSVKVIPGMKTVGVHFSYKVVDTKKGMAYIDREKSVFLRLFDREKERRQ